MLEDFRGKDCAFMANWLRGKGLNKLCAVFEGTSTLIFLILDSGFEYMNVLSCVYNEIQHLLPAIQYNNRKLNPEVNYFDLLHLNRWDFFYRTLCMLHDTQRKSEHSLTLRFPPLCTRILFVVNTLTVFLSFCYIECKLFAVFIKILFNN